MHQQTRGPIVDFIYLKLYKYIQMTASIYEKSPFLPERMVEVSNILASAYGPRFNPELAASLFERAHGCVSTRDHLGATAGIAIICGAKRISMSAAAPQPDRREKIRRHHDVLVATRDGGYGQWVTIGERYPRVQQLFEATGMKRVTDIDDADRLLEGLNAAGPLYDKDDEGRLVVVSQSDSAHPGYRQQIWSWE